MKLFVAMMALAVSGVASSNDAAEEEWPDLGEVSIEVGRLEVIHGAIEEIWDRLRPEHLDDGRGSAAGLNSWLRRGVWRYNEVRESLCAQRFVIEKSCGPPYVPKWALETRKDAPSVKELHARYEELSQRVLPLWDAACDQIKKKMLHDDSMRYCSIE